MTFWVLSGLPNFYALSSIRSLFTFATPSLFPWASFLLSTTNVAQRTFTTMAIIEEIIEDEVPQTETAHQDAKVEELNIAASMEKLELTEDEVRLNAVPFLTWQGPRCTQLLYFKN